MTLIIIWNYFVGLFVGFLSSVVQNSLRANTSSVLFCDYLIVIEWMNKWMETLVNIYGLANWFSDFNLR